MLRKTKYLTIYIGLVLTFLLSLLLLLQPYFSSHPSNGLSQVFSNDLIFSSIKQHLHYPLSILLLQIIIILAVSRTFAFLFTKLGQPPVMGEIIAGIALGPSLLGWILPEVSHFVFPQDSLQPLQFLSQIGLLFFMFIIGMELDVMAFKRRLQQSVIVSHTGIFISFFIGTLTGLWIYDQFAPPQTGPIAFALFVGMSMSITAFPVMARILQEKGYMRKSFGTMMIGIAAVDDITAWCLLATLIAYLKAGTIVGALPTILLSIGYLGVMFGLIQPFLKKLGSIYVSRENLSRSIMGIIFGILLISSYITEVIGIHAFFGAFVAGVVMPPSFSFKKVLTEKIEDFSLVLLLPLFFVFTGLRTEIGLLNSGSLWLTATIIIGIAVSGKFLGGVIGSKITGQPWKEAFMIGALLNSRGLVELIVLNIGYDMGLLSAEIFTILVLMALTTTFITGPWIDFIEWIYKRRNIKKGLPLEQHIFKVLISFGPPRMGAKLMKIAGAIIGDDKNQSLVYALHMTPNIEITHQEATVFEREGFAPIKKMANSLGLPLKTLYKVADQIETEIIRTAKKKSVNLLMMGGARSLFTENITGGRVDYILQNSPYDTGIFIDKGLESPDRILVLLSSDSETTVTAIAERLSKNPDVRVDAIDLNSSSSNISNNTPITMIEAKTIDKTLLDRYDLLLIGIDYWHKLTYFETAWLNYSPSILILSSAKKDLENPGSKNQMDEIPRLKEI